MVRTIKTLLRPVVVPLLARIPRAISRFTPPEILWRRRRDSEAMFWQEWVETRGAGWSEDGWARRLATDTELTGDIADLVAKVPTPTVSILDVGAGPATSLGKRHPRKEIAITAIDPLAADYRRMFDETGVQPPVRTQEANGEDLLARFGPRSFDIVYARNSLDHTYDPIRVLRGMVHVARHFVFLEHERNEGERQGYAGLHNWNLDSQDGRFVLWNLRERYEVGRELGVSPDVTLDQEGWIRVTIRAQEVTLS